MSFTEYEVGKYYRVPCVRTEDCRKSRPVFLPLHEDAALIGFPHYHYHEDPRFLDSRDYKQFSFERVFCPTVGVLGPAEYRLRKCKRAMPEYPRHMPWRISLAHAYAKEKLRNGICPHKGTDLTTCPVVDGIVTCPGHGLRWNVTTGKLVREQVTP
jgi:hypothetical protein